MKLFSFCSVVLISGIGSRLLTIRLVPGNHWWYVLSLSFFGIINIGAAYLMILPFSAPIPTSSFIRVALCICGMACQDMSYLASSIPYESLMIGSWVTLSLTCRLTMFPVGQRILSVVMVFCLKSRTAPISCKVCLSIN